MAESTAQNDVGGRADNSPGVSTFDSSALEAKLEAKMAEMNKDEEHFDDEVVDDEDHADVEDAEDGDSDDSQADQEDEESEDEDEGDTDVTDSEDEEADAEAADDTETTSGKSPTLPEAYRRSLAAYGWTDDEIDNNLELLGGKFVEVASNIHAKRNAEVAQWADAGRKARDEGVAAQQAQQGPVVNGVPQTLQPIDLTKMKEKYGEEEMLEEIINPVNNTIAALNAVLPQIQQGVQSIEQTQMDAATSRVHQFFDSDKLSAYRKFYGGAEHERTPEQLEVRRQVLDDAVMIMAGASASHREFTLEQALEMAHDKASSTFREQAVRKGIKRETKKRNRGITQKPSRRRSSSKESGPPTRAQLERKIGGMLKKVF
jgi:hypothetical protein